MKTYDRNAKLTRASTAITKSSGFIKSRDCGKLRFCNFPQSREKRWQGLDICPITAMAE